MSAEQTPDIADVLAEHEAVRFSLISEHGPWHLTCSCKGWTCDCEDPMSIEDGDCLDNGEHRAHVAAAVLDSPVLAAAVREAEQRAWEVAAQRRNEARRYYVAWQVARMRARAYRADRITEPVSHEAATSGEEASKA